MMDQSKGILEFEKLNWKEIDMLDRDSTIFFLPISPMEEHGPHLPVGTDFLTAKDAAFDAMKQIHLKNKDVTCVLLPAVPLGFCKFNTDFPGSISVSSKTIQDVVFSFGEGIAKHGFKMLMICTYHMAFGHLKGIYAAMKQLKKQYDMIVCEPWSPVFYTDKIKNSEPQLGFDTDKEVHGGFRETSLMKYQYPYLVNPSYKELQSIYRDTNSPKVVGKTFSQIGLKEGYIGSPAKADADYGRWFYNFTVETFVSAAHAMINKEQLPDLPSHVKSKMKLIFWQ